MQTNVGTLHGASAKRHAKRPQILISLLISLIIMAAGCSDTAKQKSSPAASAQNPRELPMPAVPSDITSPAERADYVALHLWDSLDFNNAPEAADTAFIEQNLANFLLFLSHGTPEGADIAVANLLDRASTSRRTLDPLLWAVDHYLYDPNSPMYNEEQYMIFLRHTSRMDALSPEERERDAERLRDASKIRPGDLAPDFSLSLFNGGRASLHRLLGANRTLLIFYDPDCEHCAEIIAQLADDETLNANIASGNAHVIAVDAEGDRDLWRKHAPTLPSAWSVGFDESGIRDNAVYVYRATPTIYLLDSAGVILAKDLPIHLLPRFLQN